VNVLIEDFSSIMRWCMRSKECLVLARDAAASAIQYIVQAGKTMLLTQ
jgi:hypothetical protein